jgi:hypothetical protein
MHDDATGFGYNRNFRGVLLVIEVEMQDKGRFSRPAIVRRASDRQQQSERARALFPKAA